MSPCPARRFGGASMRPSPARRFGGGAKMSPIYTLSGHQRTSQCENAKECQHWIDLFSGYAGGGRQGGGRGCRTPGLPRDALRSSHSARPARDRRGPRVLLSCVGRAALILRAPVRSGGETHARCAQIFQSYVWDRRQVVRGAPRPLSPHRRGGDLSAKTKPAAVT